jgi:hypothetical protein
MTIQTVQLSGRRFVIIPEREFERLRRKAEESEAQDRRDIAESKRRRSEGPARPYSALRKKLGLT